MLSEKATLQVTVIAHEAARNSETYLLSFKIASLNYAR